jgi:hypothetical protein
MKFTCEIEINAPIEKVAALWFDESNNKHWQDGFESIQLLEGEKNVEGAKSRLLYNNGKMELMETVLICNYPLEKKGLYEHKHMSNTQHTFFKDMGNDTTLYVSEVDYIAFHHFMPKLMFKLFPSMFKKMSMKWMKQFKMFVESNS